MCSKHPSKCCLEPNAMLSHVLSATCTLTFTMHCNCNSNTTTTAHQALHALAFYLQQANRCKHCNLVLQLQIMSEFSVRCDAFQQALTIKQQTTTLIPLDCIVIAMPPSNRTISLRLKCVTDCYVVIVASALHLDTCDVHTNMQPQSNST